jgi:Na+-translocating ferredoxin:NAD+ oxidoreductase RnfD subunit
MKGLGVGKFFSTPKGLLILILTLLAVPGAIAAGIRTAAPFVIGAVLVAAFIDVFVLRAKTGIWEIPDGAILTGLFIAMVLSTYQPKYVAVITSAVAIVSKHVFRSRWANVFNPAAFALVATFYVFDTAQNWWGALPEVNPVFVVVLFATGYYIVDRVNKMPLVLSFLAGYYLLFTIQAFAGNPRAVAEIFRAPDLHASLFFAFFILTDPPTSPVKYPHQMICGVLVAIASYLFFEFVGAAYYLLAGVLVGNVYEAVRREHAYWVRGMKPLKV